jgi:hypothetical protein
VLGFTPFSWIDRIARGATRLEQVPNLASLVRLAIVERVDAAFASVAVIRHHLDATGLNGALIFVHKSPVFTARNFLD